MWSSKKQNKELKLKPPSFRSMMKEIISLYKPGFVKATKNSCLKRLGEGGGGGEGEISQNVVKPNGAESRKFWSHVWSQNVEHNKSTEWINEVKESVIERSK